MEYSNTSSLVNAVTGWNTTTWELMKVGERAATMARVFEDQDQTDETQRLEITPRT